MSLIHLNHIIYRAKFDISDWYFNFQLHKLREKVMKNIQPTQLESSKSIWLKNTIDSIEIQIKISYFNKN